MLIAFFAWPKSMWLSSEYSMRVCWKIMFEGQWNAFLSLCVFRNCYIVRVIIYCDGETSEISLTTRALIYAELMGDYHDSWKVFTWD